MQRLLILTSIGVFISFGGLTLSSSLGHRLGLLLGVPKAVFEVDFNHPQAMLIAVWIQLAIVSTSYYLAGSVIKATFQLKKWEMLLMANPIVGLFAFLLYRIVQPFQPEHAYFGPVTILMSAFGFPICFLALKLGSRDV